MVKRKNIWGRGPSNINLGIFVWSFKACRASKLFPPLTVRWMNRIYIVRLSIMDTDWLVWRQVRQVKQQGFCHRSVAMFHIWSFHNILCRILLISFCRLLVVIISVHRTKNFPVLTGNDWVCDQSSLFDCLNVVTIIIAICIYIILTGQDRHQTMQS